MTDINKSVVSEQSNDENKCENLKQNIAICSHIVFCLKTKIKKQLIQALTIVAFSIFFVSVNCF